MMGNMSYDELLRLKSLTNTQNFSYTYNTQGNISSNGIDTYNYDLLDRISQADYTTKLNKKTGESFDYDPMGNRDSTQKSFSITTKKNGEKTSQSSFEYEVNNLNQYLNLEKNTGPVGPPVQPPLMPNSSPFRGEGDNPIETGTGEVVVEMDGKLLYDNNGNLI